MFTSLALAALVSSSSGGLLSDYASPHMRFIDVPAETAGFVARVSKYAAPNLEQLTVEQLRAERARLEDERPGLGLPIGLLIGGGVLAAVGYGVFWGVASAGLIMMGAGVAAMVVGTVFLIINISKRSAIGRDLTYIDSLIRTRTMGAPPGMPGTSPDYVPPSDVPPPPPPPPPGVFAPVPPPQLQLASF